MRPCPAVLLTRNPTKDFYPERPSGVKDLSSSHMSIPICHSPPSLALTKNTAPFVCRRLHTLPSSVSCKSCLCRSYKNGRVCTNNSRSGTPRSALADPPLGYFDGATSLFRSAHSAFSVIGACPDRVGALNPSFPFFRLSTFNFGLSTFVSLRPIPFLFTFLRTLLHFFARHKNSTLLFSCDSALFAQNTRGWGGGHSSQFPSW